MTTEIQPALTAEEWRDSDGLVVGRLSDGRHVIDDVTIRAYCATAHGYLVLSQPQSIDVVIQREGIPALIALANATLSDDDPRKITKAHAEAVSDALYALHGPKMDGPRNDTERGLLYLAEILRALLPP